jgi:hypothetical protein
MPKENRVPASFTLNKEAVEAIAELSTITGCSKSHEVERAVIDRLEAKKPVAEQIKELRR